MGISEVKNVFDLLSLVVAILLLVSALLRLRKKPFENSRRRNATLSGLFASMVGIVGFFTSGLANFLVVAILSGASTYFFILFLEVSRNVLNKDVDYDKYLALECSYILTLAHFLVYPLTRFMSTGYFFDLVALFVTVSIFWVGARFLSSLIKREESWTVLTSEERRKHHRIKELFLCFSLSLGLWALYFLGKIVLFLASLAVAKSVSPPVSRRRFASVLVKLPVLLKTFRARRLSVKADIWQNLTNVENFPSGYVYGWVLCMSSIYIALNLRFLDPLQTSQVLVTLVSFLPALSAYLSLRNGLSERYALPAIFSPWITILICIWRFPFSSPVQNAMHLVFSTSYPEWSPSMVSAYASMTSSYLSTLFIVIPMATIYSYIRFDSAFLRRDKSSFKKWVKIFYLTEFLAVSMITAAALWNALLLLGLYYATNLSLVYLVVTLVFTWFLFLTGALIYFVSYRTRIESTLDLMKEPQ